MKTKNFAVFILSHGRANNIITLEALKAGNYTGKTYIIIDDEDNQADLVKKKWIEHLTLEIIYQIEE